MKFEDFDDSFEIVQITDPAVGERADSLFAQSSTLSRSYVCTLMEQGFAFCKETPIKKSFRSTGDSLTLFVPPPADLTAKPENIPLDILYEDEHLLVVNKPQGMVVHPAAGNYDHTLVNALLYHCKDSLSGIGGVLRPGIVHRIDKDTSGLLIVAKTDAAHTGLSEQIRAHSFSRRYFGMLWGTPKEENGVVECAIGRAKNDRKKMAAYPVDTPNTKYAKTSYRTVEQFRRFSLAEFTLHTGRTHQIRVHAAMLGHPIVGDPLYAAGRDAMGQSGQLLHAAHIGFLHPVTGAALSFEAPLPVHMDEFLSKLRKNPHEQL